MAALIDADLLVLLSDIDGLYTGDPRARPDRAADRARGRPSRRRWRPRRGAGGLVGTGGMVTKLQAAQKAMAAGIPMVIADGRRPGALRAVVKGEAGGDLLRAAHRPPGRPQALDRVRAARAGLDRGRRRRAARPGRARQEPPAVGRPGRERAFAAGDAVGVRDADGREFARGIVSWTRASSSSSAGAKTADMERLLGVPA